MLTYLVSCIVQVRILDDSFGRPAQAAQHHPEQAPPGGLVDAMRVMGTSISQCGTSYYMAPEVRVVPTTLGRLRLLLSQVEWKQPNTLYV